MIMDRQRILYVEGNEDHTVGGSHQALHDTIRYLDRDRYEPVALFYQDNMFRPRLEALGVEVLLYQQERAHEWKVRTSGRWLAKHLDFIGAILRRRRFLRTHRINLVHLNNALEVGGDDWLPAAWLCGIPVVASLMGPAERHGRVLGRWLRRRIDHVFAISKHIAETARAVPLPASRISLVHLGVDTDAIRQARRRTRAEVRRELGISASGDPVLFVMVGNIRQWKGQHVVISALGALAPAERARTHVAFVGDVDQGSRHYLEALQATLRRDGTESSVSWMGFREDRADFFAAADVAIHASVLPEPFGLVLVEALALGTPVIASAAGGPCDILTSETGWLFPPGNADALAAIMREILADPGAIIARGARAPARAEHFRADQMAAGIMEVYGRLLG
jgi:glycosyltransferase involved in cell wall biosynthesis